MKPILPAVTVRDRELLDRLSQHEPLSTSELHLLFFSGLRTCRRRLSRLEAADLLVRVFPTRSTRGGSAEALWFLSPNGRRVIGAPARRLPGLSIPDLEHRRAGAHFFLALIERSLNRPGEGLYAGSASSRHRKAPGRACARTGTAATCCPRARSLSTWSSTVAASLPAGSRASSTTTVKHSRPTRAASRGTSCSSARVRGGLRTSHAALRLALRGCGAPSRANATRCYPAKASNARSASYPQDPASPATAPRTASVVAGAAPRPRAPGGRQRERRPTHPRAPRGKAEQEDPRPSPVARRRARARRSEVEQTATTTNGAHNQRSVRIAWRWLGLVSREHRARAAGRPHRPAQADPCLGVAGMARPERGEDAVSDLATSGNERDSVDKCYIVSYDFKDGSIQTEGLRVRDEDGPCHADRGAVAAAARQGRRAGREYDPASWCDPRARGRQRRR